MSRKKVKKEVVKRKTNIYDPMGIYGRGLTENQRLGMTRQMKVENVRESEPVITKGLLDEYKKTLIYYGIPTVPYTRGIEFYSITVPLSRTNVEIRNDVILAFFASRGIKPVSFLCTSFRISKTADLSSWNSSLTYRICVGNSEFSVVAEEVRYTADERNDDFTVGSYFVDGTFLNYFQIKRDLNSRRMYSQSNYIDMSNDPDVFEDFFNLPNDGTIIPFLLYPNNTNQELYLSIYNNVNEHMKYSIKLKVMVTY